jgi:hypothetical protein
MTLCRQSIAPRLKTRPVRIQYYKQVINLLLALRLLVSFALSLEHGSLGMTRLGVISEFHRCRADSPAFGIYNLPLQI